jgi:hypothetical protein
MREAAMSREDDRHHRDRSDFDCEVREVERRGCAIDEQSENARHRPTMQPTAGPQT